MNWQFATPEEFIIVSNLFESSGLSHGGVDVRRRVTIPIFLRQLITFYDGAKLCGFVTFAWLNDEAESHMPTTGIYPTDWRSGKNFWVVDFVVRKGFNGFKMLRVVTRELGIKRAKYFRNKFKDIREVRA